MQFHPQFLIDSQFINMSSQEVSMERGFVNQYDEGDMVEFTQPPPNEPVVDEEDSRDLPPPPLVRSSSSARKYALLQHMHKRKRTSPTPQYDEGDMVEFTQPSPNEPVEIEQKNWGSQDSQDTQDLPPPLVRSSSSKRRRVLLQRMPTRKRTPPTLQRWDRSVLPMWQTFGGVLQEPNTIYIGPKLKKYAASKWGCGRLTYLLYTGKITPAEYRQLYEEFVRQKLWSDLHELEGKRLIFFEKDPNKCNGPILLRLFAEKFGDNLTKMRDPRST